jgi:hypothetical protein
LVWRNQPFIWELEVEFAFQSLKAFFLITSLLARVNPFKPFILEMNNFALGDMFTIQKNDLHLVGFCFL